uniref:Uncharacterized protein n=1 Tax=Oncorhynchus mykiss TaxID=8022 RepID=A0A8K9Y3N9_ONCMY
MDSQCQHRWQKVLNPEMMKGPWTKEEDERVKTVSILCVLYGPKQWSIITKHLHGRIGQQCRERWHNHLNRTQEEDQIIYAAHKRIGNRWTEESKLLPGRKVEHEVYLQDVTTQIDKTKAPIKRRTKSSCSSRDSCRARIIMP